MGGLINRLKIKMEKSQLAIKFNQCELALERIWSPELRDTVNRGFIVIGQWRF